VDTLKPTAAALGHLLRTNPRQAGEVLPGMLWKPSALAMLPNGCGWNDGGCMILATALQLIAPEGKLAAIIDAQRPGVAQHVLLEISVQGQTWYIDADGATDEDGLLDRWRKLEALAQPQLVPFERQLLDDETPDDPAASTNLAQHLTDTRRRT